MRPDLDRALLVDEPRHAAQKALVLTWHAQRLGFGTVRTAEAYGSAAPTPQA